MVEKRSTLNAKWQALSDEEKAPYIAAADFENDNAEKFKGEGFHEFLQRCGGAVSLASKRTKYISDRFRAVQVTASKILASDVFDSGSAIYAYDSGLRSSLIKSNLSRAAVQEEYKRLFGYDHEPLKSRPMPFFTPCCLRFGGLCGKDEIIDKLETLTYNIYANTREWKDDFPVLLRIRGWHAASAEERWVFLGRLIGEGKLAFFTPLTFVRVEADGFAEPFDAVEMDFVPYDGEKPIVVPVASHRFFWRLMHGIQHSIGESVHNISRLVVERWDFEYDDTVEFFRARLLQVRSRFELFCDEKLNIRKRKSDADTDDFGFIAKRRRIPELTTKSTKTTAKAAKKATGIKHETEPKKVPIDDDENISDDGFDTERSWVSAFSGTDNDDVSDISDNETSEEEEAWNVPGLKLWEVTKKHARAKCAICDGAIKPDSVRFDYRFKMSKSIGDQLRIHPGCAGDPRCAATRPRDIKLVSKWLKDEDVTGAVRTTMEETLALMRGAS